MRQEQLAKISELLSDPASCKLGLDMVLLLKSNGQEVTAQEMCRIIQRSSLSNLRKGTLATYLMYVDSLTFNNTLTNPSNEVSVAFDDWFEGRIADAKWKPTWLITAHDDGDHFDQRLTLTDMGIYGFRS